MLLYQNDILAILEHVGYYAAPLFQGAKRLLRYSERPLSATSDYLGFSSHGHFSRAFKKYAGLTPVEYRERHRN